MNVSELKKTIISEYDNITSMMVIKNGEKVYEGYYNGSAAADSFHVFSVAKSVFSILIGIAVDKGYIKSVDQKVLEFFPEYRVQRGEKTLQSITIKNLLTMTAPYKYKSAPYTKYFTSDDWVKSALDLLGGKGTVGEFRYTPLIGPDILSGILVNVSGKTPLDFANENLFLPLGIDVPQNIVFQNKEEQLAFYKAKSIRGWVANPHGINTAAWGLCLRPCDLANIGQLYLKGGTWKGTRIVSAEWIAESTKEHSRWEKVSLSYGYLWWIIDADSYAALGDGGNVIYVNTRKKLVIVITSLFKPNARDRIELIKKEIELMF